MLHSKKVLSFCKIPSSKKPLLRQKWLHNIRRKPPLPKDSSFYICSVHFDETCFKRNLQVSNFIILSRTKYIFIFVISLFTKIYFLCLISYLFELFTNLSSRLFNSNRNMKTIFEQKKTLFEAFTFVFTMIEKSFDLKLGV